MMASLYLSFIQGRAQMLFDAAARHLALRLFLQFSRAIVLSANLITLVKGLLNLWGG